MDTKMLHVAYFPPKYLITTSDEYLREFFRQLSFPSERKGKRQNQNTEISVSENIYSTVVRVMSELGELLFSLEGSRSWTHKSIVFI